MTLIHGLRRIPNINLINRYVNCSRYFSSFSSLSQDDLHHFRAILGPSKVKTDSLEGYNQDWLRSHTGQSKLALFPSSTEEVSNVLSYCNQKSLPIVVQAGNTSLVAGSVPDKDEIILSVSKLNKIDQFDETTGVLQCQSGCILEVLEGFVNEKGYLMPYDLGAKGSCQIGGNVASNAGGIRFIRYGSLHGSVLGLEAVLPDGQILDMMSSLRKDNTGYDLKQLFIGSEGTLGVITKVSILCPVKPHTKIVTFLAVPKYNDIIRIMREVKSSMSSYLSAFEMMDRLSLEAVQNNLGLTIPFDSPFYVLFELSLSESCDQEHVENQLGSMLERFMDQQVVTDGTISSDLSTVNKLWAIRERIAEALLADGKCFKYDVSLEHKDYYDIVEVMRERLVNTSASKVCGYGHIGDNNLHLTVTSKEQDSNLYRLIEPFVFEYIRDRKGSISAEHGLGMRKRNHIHYSKSPQVVQLMKQIKNMFDPKGILNPKKMLPDD